MCGDLQTVESIFYLSQRFVYMIKLFCIYQTCLKGFTVNTEGIGGVHHNLPIPHLLDDLCRLQRGIMSNDHSRPQATSPEESQRW